MNGQLYTYSMIRTFYDEGKDYIDSFWPFVLKCLPMNKSALTIDIIQDEIKKKYGLYIPQHSLSVILTRAKRNDYISQEGRKYVLTENGIQNMSGLEFERDVARRINEFIEDARSFLNGSRGVSLSTDDVNNLVQAFIRENIEFFEQFINPESTKALPAIRVRVLKEYEDSLLSYLKDVERAKPTIFKTLQDIIFGSIISAIIHSKSFPEATKKFERTTAYLDTNFVFSILGLHFEEYNKPAQELLKLMQNANVFEFKVFDFTVDETTSVLKNYEKEQHIYLPNIRVRSIYSSIKVRGWTPGSVRELIAKIEDKLWEHGIRIEPTKVDIQKYSPITEEYRNALSQCKPWQGSRGQNHDLAAIEKIIELRRHRIRHIEGMKAFFLTSDIRLARCNLLQMGHKERATICEVIPDRLLTNILWLKNPTLIENIPLGSIVSIHSRHLFIDKDVWKRFYETLRDLRARGDINEKDVSILLYDQRIREDLRTFDPENAGEVDTGWVLKNIEDAKKHLDRTKEQELEKQKVYFEQKLRQADLDRTERVLRSVSEMKEKLKTEAQNKTKYWINGLMIVVSLVLILFSISTIPLLLRKWSVIAPLVWLVTFIVPIVLSFLGFRFDPFQIREKLKSWLFNRIYRKKLQTSKLQELEASFIGSS
jgi:hypothetical protein